MTEINRKTSDQVLESVLDAYAAAGPNQEELQRWIDEYPQFRHELTELTVSWLELKHLPRAAATMESANVQLRAASILGEVLHTLRNTRALSQDQIADDRVSARAVAGRSFADFPEVPVSPAPPFDSLIDEAARRGFDIDRLAAAVGMSVAMIISFHRRLVRATSVPSEALASVGQALRSPPATIFAYLVRPPQLSAAQQFKGNQAPKITEQVDFFELVKDDPELSESERARWLSAQASTMENR